MKLLYNDLLKYIDNKCPICKHNLALKVEPVFKEYKINSYTCLNGDLFSFTFDPESNFVKHIHLSIKFVENVYMTMDLNKNKLDVMCFNQPWKSKHNSIKTISLSLPGNPQDILDMKKLKRKINTILLLK